MNQFKHKYESLEQFCQLQRQWIEQEHEEEKKFIEQLLADLNSNQIISLGFAIGKLKFLKTKILINRHLAIFEHNVQNSRLKQGDQVGLYRWKQISETQKFGKTTLTGVIEKFNKERIRILLEKECKITDDEGTLFAIAVQDNFITYKRHLQIIQKLPNFEHPLIHALFEEYHLSSVVHWDLKGSSYKQLNENQQQAIMNALSQVNVALIHGPPGTGKTCTVCELIKQAVLVQGQRVLACAPSNIAVDNMIERLSVINENNAIKYCRIGNPARTQDAVRQCCIDHLAKKTQSYGTCKEIKLELQKLEKKLVKASYQERKELKKQRSELQKEFSIQQDMQLAEVIQDSNVVFSTNTGCGQRIFRHLTKKINFDLVVIDECAQSLEVSCWIPILKGRKIVLAGDHQQLPPTIKSHCEGLELTLFQRIQWETNGQFSTLLKTQYRMNNKIMEWSSQQFYQGQLVADESVANHTTNELVEVKENDPQILAFIDTSGCEMYDEEMVNALIDDQNKSKFNISECGLVQVVVDELLGLGIRKDQIGIITPYNAQVQTLRQRIENVEISTVDGFQGREKECIIISMVRSNPEKEVGFLKEPRRMNVAVTRAKRFVCLIGDSDTVSSDKFLKDLITYFMENGEVRGAQMYIDDERVEVKIGNKKPIQQQKKIKQQKIKGKQEQKQEPEKLDYDVEYNQTELEIIEFLDSQKQKLTFYKQNAFQRRILHELAEKHNLHHESKGNKDDALKSVIIEKQNVQNIQEEQGEQIDISDGEKQQSQLKEDQEKGQEQQFQQQQQQQQGLIQQQQKQQQQNKKKKDKQQQQKKKDQKQLEKEEEEFYNSIPLINASRCAYLSSSRIQCSKPINLLSIQCKYCQRKYCSNHQLAEEHGCDEAAKLDAREKYLNQSQNRNQNVEALQKKLKEVQDARKQKQKKK